MQARIYQQKALDEIVALYKKGIKKVLLQLSTGGGKTFIFSKVLLGCHQKGTRCLMVVRGRSLVEQASRRLSEMQVPHGVFMANEYNPNEKVQVISIDTARSKQIFPPADMVIIDECHHATSDSFKDFLSHYDNAYWLSVTATPYPKKGLKHLASDVVYPISITELVEQGYLVGPKYYAPNGLDMHGVKITGDDFNDKQSREAFEKSKIYGHVSTHWKRLCVGESSLCFAIDLEHGRNLVETFTQAGARAVLIDAKTPLDRRLFLINALENKALDVIVNVGTLTTGVDIPSLQNIIMCRPTASKVLYVQMLGRGTRKHENKTYFKVLDHVGNIGRHGFIEDEEKSNLEPKKVSKNSNFPSRTCQVCFAVMRIHIHVCISCGHQFQIKETEKEFVDCDLNEITMEKDSFKRKAWQLWDHAQKYGYKVGYVWNKLKEKFGEDECRKKFLVYRSIKNDATRINYDASKNRSRYLASVGQFTDFEVMETDDGCGESW